MSKEVWKSVPSLPGVEASSHGRIRGHVRKEGSREYYVTPQGYVSILHKGKQYLVHRLVCEAWHGPAPAGKGMVLHADDVRMHNAASNLRWGSRQENAEDARRNGIRLGRPRKRPADDISHLLTAGFEG